MDAHTASFGTARAVRFQGALRTGLLREMDHRTGTKRHCLLSRASDDLPLPMQDKGLRMKLLPLAHQVATHIGPVDVQFLSRDLLPL